MNLLILKFMILNHPGLFNYNIMQKATEGKTLQEYRSVHTQVVSVYVSVLTQSSGPGILGVVRL